MHQKSGGKIVRSLKRRLTCTELGNHGIKKMKVLKNNTVLRECRSDEQEALFLKQIAEKENVTKYNPKIVIKYVRKDMGEDELSDDLICHNKFIKAALGDKNVKYAIKIIRKINFIYLIRRLDKEIWVIQVIPEIFKAVMKTGQVVVDFMTAKVEENNEFIQCRKCCKFGHSQSRCHGQLRCFKCGGCHNWYGCYSYSVRCINCINDGKANINEIGHHATSTKCPIYLRKLGNFRKTLQEKFRR
ncbi:hypothetical protein GWI33_015625 [Rhynchophorus ferrugineus]|uniref:Uncharacterized protein n=1 Tax=Rhynchophorus ferrugineus TaxID=354439 RepID=A0A834M4B2_RHYFE|nr:hypothetical protein GWI33_015625 [Rhynchophorus ferrugineus]